MSLVNNREIRLNDIQRIIQNENNIYRTWTIQELPFNETEQTVQWSRINVRPIDYSTYKLIYRCSNCSNIWTSNRHTFILVKFHRIQRRIKIRIYGQRCLMCHSPNFIRPTFDENQLRTAIDFLMDQMTNRRIVIGNGTGSRGSSHDAFKVNAACEACSFNLCENPIRE